MVDGTPLFRMEGVSKRYGGVRALENASLTVEAGRVHAILGENGAGKSTLIKIMSGVVTPDEGQMTLDGGEVRFADPAAANAAGIVCIFQELSLIPELTVADNIVISDPPRRFGMIDRRAQRRIAEEALRRAGGDDIHPMALVKDLPLSRRQIIEIAKALARKPRLLILDEATSALTAADVTRVFAVLKRLRSEGLALLFISHRMHEIAEIADTCTIFRNGRNVATYPAGSKTDNEVVELMIGREYNHDFPPKAALAISDKPPILQVKNLSWSPRLRDISFTAQAGEIVGFGGLDGQGQRELLLALFGVLRGTTGDILIDGHAERIGSPRQAKSEKIGMALIPEDRKTEGLMLSMSVLDNLSFAALGRVSRGGIIDRAGEQQAVAEMIKLLAIKTDGTAVPAGALSGGNQQKLVIAKWLMRRPRIILLNDPTRGIDVGTKQEIYTLLRRLAHDGAAVILYSTDYDELIGLCNKVLVLYDGGVKRTLEGAEITERALIGSALNIDTDIEAPGSVPAMAQSSDWRYRFAEQRGTLLALLLFVVMFTIYVGFHPAIQNGGFTVKSVGNVVQTAANKGVLLALVAMAQSFVVITAGIDLSVGMVFILTSCIASFVVVGSPAMAIGGIVLTLLAGIACGLVNGLIVVFGRLQPIVVTIATGATYFGLALWLRPNPGSQPNFASDIADAFTGKLFGLIPASLVMLLVLILVIWIPYRRSVIGRAAYAVGSSDVAAYMSGVPIARAKLVAYTLSGLFAGFGGLFLTFFTYSGEASLANGNTYTLFSIASVVLGGVSLFGGKGSAVGAVLGALAFRTIGDLLFVFNLDPLWQPLFQGVVLLLAVCLGAARLFQVRNRLDLFT